MTLIRTIRAVDLGFAWNTDVTPKHMLTGDSASDAIRLREAAETLLYAEHKKYENDTFHPSVMDGERQEITRTVKTDWHDGRFHPCVITYWVQCA